ncbi:hypothetical protein TNCV_3208311 [Trichonephila clavipes]|nr:hypothetical protein TNCV_3208311 [Trichonephila clavipes]
MTIHRWLIERNLPSHRPLRNLPLTPAHCRARLQWFLIRSGQRADPSFTIARPTSPQPGVMVRVPLLLTAGRLWASLEAHLQHSSTSTTFRELFCYRSFCTVYPGLIFSKIMPDHIRHVLL